MGTMFFVALICCCQKGNSATPPPPQTPIAIPLAGNAYVTKIAPGGSAEISKDGLSKWADKGTIASVYFKLVQSGELHIAIRGKTISGNSMIKVSVNGKDFSVNLTGSNVKSWFAGTLSISNPGYIKVDLQGISKTGTWFADVSDILIGGSATTGGIVFANDPENFYWSRRGPSCHLNYTIPEGDKEYFYSELTVPKGEDKMST